MCTGCFPDDIVVCPYCKRDDEGYKLGESDSPFRSIGGGKFRCRCGKDFVADSNEESSTADDS